MLMAKEVNCSAFKSLLDYLRKHHGDHSVEQVIDGLVNNEKYLIADKKNPSKITPVQEYHLDDSAYWVSNEFSLAIFANSKKIIGDSKSLVRIGEISLKNFYSKKSILFLSKVLGVKQVSKHVNRINNRFNRVKQIKLAELTNNKAVFHIHYHPNFRKSKDICNWNLGIYIGTAKMAGGRDVRGEETQCVMDGDDFCVIQLTWNKEAYLIKRLFRSILKLIARDMIEEYETILAEREELIDHLTESELALKKSQAELERRVAERTEKLKQSNILLKKEITERIRTEQVLMRSLGEKELLIKEIHHRVKNNLQIISSLLDMRSMRSRDADICKVLEDTQTKIHNMALIHTQLYQSQSFDQIDMYRHIKDLFSYLSEVYAHMKNVVELTIDCSDVLLPVTQAIPCAIIINELLSNAFKHAFADRKNGSIQIYMKNSEYGRVFVRIKDDGVGIPNEMDINKLDSLGLKLVANLVRIQLKGEMEVRRDGGTEVTITF
jgi:two-component sensor histidine kinase/predicted hydrocarbon binding protein